MNRSQEAKRSVDFEQILLTYAEMCYTVAFAMTRNTDRAQELAMYVLTQAWHKRDIIDAKPNIKMHLLKALRERFLFHYASRREVLGSRQHRKKVQH